MIVLLMTMKNGIRVFLNKICVRTCLPFFLFFCLAGRSTAQVFGGNPPYMKWKSMHTAPANIIFPPGLDSEARQVSYLVDVLSRKTLSTIGTRQQIVDIVFHNQTIVSNGYVQLAPFRSEFELTPSQNSFDLGSLPWNQMLAIHEYRHVQQFNNFRVGLSKAFYILFGQEGLALANNVAVPDWFFEGDAVYQETLVSEQGRGRLPLFLTGFESLWISKKNYSWMKLRNGSYRDYTPNHYPLGYMLVAYGRETYGQDFWDKTAGQTAAFKGLFYPLQKAIRRNSGISYDSFRLRSVDFFKSQVPDSSYADFAAEYGQTQKHFTADEVFPQFADSSTLIYLKKSYRLPPEFVSRSLPANREERLKFRAVSLDDAFSIRGRWLAYTAYEPDLRWGWTDYSVLRLIDLTTGKDSRLTGKTKYFAPDISLNLQTVVAVDMEPSGKSFLDILDIHSGERIRRMPNPDGWVYTYPKFSGAGTIVVAVRNPRGEMALAEIDIASGKVSLLTGWSMDPLGFISVEKDSIFFTRTWRGTDQGFCLHDGKVFRMKENAQTGNYQLYKSGGRLTWTSFTSAGYRARITDAGPAFEQDALQFSPLDTSEKHRVFSLDNTPFLIPYPIPDSAYPVMHYPALTHPFNFHSWRPYINDPDFTLALVGQNVLNSFQSEIYLGYNRNESSETAGMDLLYGGLFPFINLGAQYVFNRSAYYKSQKVYWNEFLPYMGISVPLNFSRGRWYTNLNGGVNLTYHQPYFQGIYKDSFQNQAYFSLDPQLLFTHQLQQGRMQIFPSFAQSLLIRYDRATSHIEGNQFLTSAGFYFPGLTSTNSLVLTTAVQQRDSLNQVRFTDNFPFARGYTAVNFYREYGWGINYHFPLFYPDWGFGNLVYFLRVRANLFFDDTYVPYYAANGPGVQTQYRSAGVEIYFDTKWWNQLPLGFGIRYSRLLDPDYGGRGPNQWEFILPVNILSKGYSIKPVSP